MYLFWVGKNALELAEEELGADFLVEVADAVCELFRGEPLDRLNENLCRGRSVLDRERSMYTRTDSLLGVRVEYTLVLRAFLLGWTSAMISKPVHTVCRPRALTHP